MPKDPKADGYTLAKELDDWIETKLKETPISIDTLRTWIIFHRCAGAIVEHLGAILQGAVQQTQRPPSSGVLRPQNVHVKPN